MHNWYTQFLSKLSPLDKLGIIDILKPAPNLAINEGAFWRYFLQKHANA